VDADSHANVSTTCLSAEMSFSTFKTFSELQRTSGLWCESDLPANYWTLPVLVYSPWQNVTGSLLSLWWQERIALSNALQASTNGGLDTHRRSRASQPVWE